MNRTDIPAFLLIALALVGCRDAGDPQTGEAPNAPSLDPFVTATIESLLAERPEFGGLLGEERIPDWAKGTRRRVMTETGEYLFYMKDGEVYGGYTFAQRGGRLWLTGPRFRKDAAGARWR